MCRHHRYRNFRHNELHTSIILLFTGDESTIVVVVMP